MKSGRVGSRSDFPWPVISIVTLSNNQRFRPTVPPSRGTEMDLFSLGGGERGFEWKEREK